MLILINILRAFIFLITLPSYACVGNPKVEKALAVAPTVLQNCYSWVISNPVEASLWGGILAAGIGILVFSRGGAFTPILSVLKAPKVYSPGVYSSDVPNSNLSVADKVKTQDSVSTPLQINAMPEPLVQAKNDLHLTTLDLVGAPQNSLMFKRLIDNFCIENFMVEYFTIIQQQPIAEDGVVNYISEKCPNIPRDEIAAVVQEICARLS